MDVRQLRYFVNVVEAGSFTAASHQLRIAQPSLSQHVIALEKELGIKLLEREARGVRLTTSGSTFLEHARTVLRDLERAREAVAATGTDIVGRVAIGLPTTVAPFFATPLMQAALASLPNVTLHLVESHSGFLREWLDMFRLDVALLFNVSDAEGLELTPLIAEDLHVISPGGAAKQSKQIALREIPKLDLIMASSSHDLRKTLDNSVLLASGQPLHVKAEVDSLFTIKQMVAAGLGHTVLPLATVRSEVAGGILAARRIVRPRIERQTAMACVSRRPKTRAQVAVAGLILQVSKRLIAEDSWTGRRLLKA